MTKSSDAWVALAVVTQPHGVRGQVKIKSFSDPVDGFAAYPSLCDAKGNPVKLRITGEAGGLLIASITGVNDRNAADLWRGRELGVPRSALKPIARDDAFYVADLVGMAVVSPEGATVGQVRAVVNYGAGDLLEIADMAGHTEFYSFTERNFPALDLDAGRITFTPPEVTGSKSEESGA